MEDSSFYVTLPSSASMDIHPRNTQASFKVVMPKTLYVNHGYEVGLAEIHYPHTWETFADAINYTIDLEMEDARKTITFVRGYYSTVKELVDEMATNIRDSFIQRGYNGDEVLMKYNKISQKVRVLTKPPCKVKFSEACCDILGLKHEWLAGEVIGEHIADIARGFHTLYVYCSVCRDQIVGNVMAPLIRTVGVEGQRGQHITRTFEEPHYVPVNPGEVNEIEINIKDDTGEDVSFMSGKVLVKLHFRQRTI